MTLNAAYRCSEHPILISDFLVSEQGRSGAHIDLPTVENVDRVVPAGSNVTLVNLLRKSARILPNLVIGGSGTVNGIATVLRRLRNYCWREMTFEEFAGYLYTQDDIPEPGCTLTGHFVEAAQIHTFRWRSKDRAVEEANEFVQGSGRRLFLETIPHLQFGAIDPGHQFEGARECALYATVTLYANELKLGNTLSDKFGVGYDIFVFADGEFRLVDGATYLLFQTRWVDGDTLRLFRLPTHVQSSYFGEACLVRSLIAKTGVRDAASPHERVALIRPLYTSPNEPLLLPDTPLSELPLTSPVYGIGILGTARDGADEVFSAVVSGEEARFFNIQLTGTTRGDLHEVRFDMPGNIMSNIVSAAVTKFRR
jgi:hypothetical protein